MTFKYMVSYKGRTLKIIVKEKYDIIKKCYSIFGKNHQLPAISSAVLQIYDDDFKCLCETNPQDLPDTGQIFLSFEEQCEDR